jgi:hypothetical protein
MVRTSLELPERVWIKAKTRAAEERIDFRQLLLEGLEMRLAKKKGGG